jgi:hypothetical protein
MVISLVARELTIWVTPALQMAKTAHDACCTILNIVSKSVILDTDVTSKMRSPFPTCNGSTQGGSFCREGTLTYYDPYRRLMTSRPDIY